MRTLIALAVLATAAAGPALAQSPTTPANQFDLDVLRNQQDSIQRRSIDQANQLQALDARVQTDQAISNLQRQREGQYRPQLQYPSAQVGDASPASAISSYPTVPNATLSDSNRRVQAAAANRK